MPHSSRKYYLKRVGFLLFAAMLIAALPLAHSILHSASSANVTRGPYLQSASQTGITIVWNTDQAFAGKLRYGQNPAVLDREVITGAGMVHVAQLSDLQPDTKYFYAVEVGGSVVFTGSEFWFRTYPPAGSARPFTFLAWGDSGTGDTLQTAVATQMDSLWPRPEFALGIGDLVYPAGEAANYNSRYFTPYRSLIRNMVIWPAMGNHDAATATGQPYLDAFYCPTDTGSSTNPSNTELYYSFDYGNSHFVCLDSQVTYAAGATDRNTMLQWLADDLDSANTRGARWKFVYFHHPPYTKGTHDSDTEAQLVWMRNNLNPTMESRGVDMVLTGHSHVYERSFLLKNDAVLQGSAADYTKIATPDGCIYIVTGCGGRSGTGALNHPLMAFSRGNIAGNSVIDVSADACRGYYIQSDGQRIDLFSLSKAADTAKPFVRSVAAATSSVELVFNEPLENGAGANGAENPGNYTISGGIGVIAATLLSDVRSVRLDTDSHNPASAYAVTINNLHDRATSPNTIAANARVVYSLPPAGGGNQAPVSAFTADALSLNTGGTVSFNGAASYDPDGTISAYAWDFGDGAGTASGYTAAYTYAAAGVYLASLAVTDDSAAQAVSHRLIYVHGIGNLPVANASASASSISPGGAVTFSSVGSNDPDGGAVWTNWDFDDPASGNANHSSLGSPAHTFANTGYYKVTLTVTDDEGSQAVASLTITVGTPAATPSITTSGFPDAVAGSAYHYSLSAEGGTTPYMWSLAAGAPPGGMAFGSNGALTGTPTSEGSATFTVRVQDGTAQPATRIYSVKVLAPPKGNDNDDGCSTGRGHGHWLSVLAPILGLLLVRQLRSFRR